MVSLGITLLEVVESSGFLKLFYVASYYENFVLINWQVDEDCAVRFRNDLWLSEIIEGGECLGQLFISR